MWGHMSTTDLPGSSLLASRYRLVERLGAGGMSVVWRGFDEVLGRQVAVKVLPPSTSTDPSFRRRLRAEAQAAARLSHPHITNVYDYGEATTVDGEPVPYVVMELVDGESLAAVLARSRRLPWPAAVRIASEVSAALAAAHARGIVHRDVTPANVMLTPSGAKVVDFGISALIGENDIDPDGSLLGTPAYLAPERLEGGQVSPATDVYAVGLLIYRTLIGQLPWDVGTTTALLRAHQYTEPEPLPHVEGLPPAVEALIARCLEKRPDDRPSSAEVAHVLAGVAAGNPATRGFVPDWADSSEDTTILPSMHPYTDAIGRMPYGQNPYGQAPVEPPPGRGVAAVGGRAPGSRVSDAPISPAPGSAMPVSLSAVHAAVGGVPAPSVPSGPVGPPKGNGRGPQPGPGGGRNSRFAGSPQVASAAAVAAAAAAPAEAGYQSLLRPAFNERPAPQAGDGGTPPTNTPPGSGRTGDGNGRGRGGGPQTRRVVIAAGLVVLAGAATYAWSLTANSASTKPSAQPTVIAANGKCVVSYTVFSEANGKFKASVTVANRDTVPIKDWTLWFLMPGDQVMSGSGKERLTQQSQQVTVTAAAPLSAQGTRTMQVTGSYKESNAVPQVFQLDGKDCETYVSSKPGAPSQPVQHLSDGTTRLAPAPTASTPIPGLSTAPNGVVIPIPVASTTNPTVAATTTTGTGTTTTPPTTAPTTEPPGAKPPPASDPATTDPTTAPTTEPTTAPTTASPPPTVLAPPTDD
jgi:serine/threonine protein kinase